METKYIIPRGYRFRPTDVEIVRYYLTKKNKGDPLPEVRGKILERKLYGDEATPWNILTENDPWEDVEGSKNKKFIYVFCKLIPMNRVRICRTAGCGTWEGKAVNKDIKRGRSVIGHKRSFTFKPKNEIDGRGNWIMHEYSLRSSANRIGEDYVLCRITKDLSKICDGGGGGDGDGDSDGDEQLHMQMENGQGFEYEEIILPNVADQENIEMTEAVESRRPSMHNQNDQLDASVDYLGNIDGFNDDQVNEDNINDGFDIEDHFMKQQRKILSLLKRDNGQVNPYS